ncbi:MAG: flagellar biosynthesis protein FlhA [Sphingomonadaceae bacterium]|nr:flagellar biosynthesis protein FlhA [Sphingomonadaceae bacterium]
MTNPLWKSLVSGAALPAAILALVLLMVVPVPALLLDIGFITNIMISLAVLMVALSAARPLDFSAFPTVLLLATLFRLALNVASTRVVLVDGHQGAAAAGHVIEAFGAFLIGGDYVVGLFVFAVLMIINLVVITKGAGRVSEVSARFTLDALPGKQMAIDADLNAGLLTPDEAKARRQEVATEADFYGSMDGASKFVKGDAVAGLLILFVNIVGGLILGVVSHELSLGDAARTYVTLAIGDALVAQIPALLLSIAAAAIVTRVSSPFDLSGQIGSQFGQWRAWAPVAAILGLLGLIPAMPQLVVLPAAAVAGAICWSLRRQALAVGADPIPATPSEPYRIEWADICDAAPIRLELGYGLVSLVDERRGAPLMARVTAVRRQLSRQFGFVLPPVKVEDDLALPANRYRIRISGVVAGEGDVWPADLLALDSGDCLEAVEGRACKDPTFGLDALWIAGSRKIDAIAAGYTVVDPATVIATHLNRLVGNGVAELFGHDEAQALIGTLKDDFPQLAQSLTPTPFPLTAITQLCRALLAEQVPLRDFRAIAAAMLDSATPEMATGQLVEAVRRRLGGVIAQTIVPADMPLPGITIEAELESMLLQAVRTAPDASWPVEPGLARQLVDALHDALPPLHAAARSCALLTTPLCRAPLARLLRSSGLDLPVLSFLEIPDGKPVDIVATIGGAAQAISGSVADQKD